MEKILATEKQQIANGKNSLKGGVKTTAGKNVSSQNALKHGGLAKKVFKEEREFFSELLQTLTDELGPKTTVDLFLIERITIRILQSRRLHFASKELWKSAKNPRIVVDTTGSLNPFLDVEEEGYDPEIDVESLQTLAETVHRYESSIENQIIKMMKSVG